MLGVLLVGLSSIIATMGWWFDWVRIAGAVYLVWLGWKLLRATAFGEIGRTPAPRGGFFLQGFLVLMSNPKALSVVRRLHSAIRRSERKLRWADRAARRDRDGTAAVTDGAYALLGGAPGGSCRRSASGSPRSFPACS